MIHPPLAQKRGTWTARLVHFEKGAMTMNKGAFYKLSYGLYVITSGEGGKFNGQIANTVFQVTSEPPTVAVSINKANYTHEFIQVRTGKTGVPIVTDHTVAFMEAEVIGEMDCGTHTLFLGKVVECDILDAAAEPMTYAYYHEIKGGKSPKNAPTYQMKESRE